MSLSAFAVSVADVRHRLDAGQQLFTRNDVLLLDRVISEMEERVQEAILPDLAELENRIKQLAGTRVDLLMASLQSVREAADSIVEFEENTLSS